MKTLIVAGGDSNQKELEEQLQEHKRSNNNCS